MKYLDILLISVVTSLALMSCQGEDNALGINEMPDYSRLTSESTSIAFSWQTVSADTENPTTGEVWHNKIYVSPTYAYLGDMPNELYGQTACDYMTQFYCPSGFKFTYTPEKKVNPIDSAYISLYYKSFTGDSIAPIAVSVYKLKETPQIPFTNKSVSDFSKYYDEADKIGQVSYYAGRGLAQTASGLSVINIPISNEIGNEIYRLSQSGSSEFASQEAFNKYFPGIYVSVMAGTGSIIRIEATAMTLFYDAKRTVLGSNKKDSIAVLPTVQQLAHTSEVPQILRFTNTNLDRLIKTPESEKVSYIKSPAGVLTELTLPISQIKANILDQVKDGYEREIISVPFTLEGISQGSGAYKLQAPTQLMLIPKDSVDNVFSKSYSNASSYAFISQRTTSGSTTFSFGNIASLINKYIKDSSTKDLKLLVIPVEQQASGSANNRFNYESSQIAPAITVSNLILPSGIKIDFSGKKNQLNIIYTEKKKGAPF